MGWGQDKPKHKPTNSMFNEVAPATSMDQLIADLLVVQTENPKATVSLTKLTQGLYKVAKVMQERGYCHADNSTIGIYMSNIQHQHPQAFPYYDTRVRELMTRWLDEARQ